MSHPVALTLALAPAAGMAVQRAAWPFHVPVFLLLPVAGVLLGREGLGRVSGSIGNGLFILFDFAVAMILFEGGLNLTVQWPRPEQRGHSQARHMVGGGRPIGGTVASRSWLEWPWRLALLFRPPVVVTGPTVVSPLDRDLRLHPRLQTVLDAEGVRIDPVGALLTALGLQIALASDEAPHDQERRDVWMARIRVGLTGAPEAAPSTEGEHGAPQEEFVLITPERNGRIVPMYLSAMPKNGGCWKAPALLTSAGWRPAAGAAEG